MFKFSVIVPVYNTEAYINACILSVIQQTYSAWELILVNDGSTDSSGEICDRYAQIYPDRIVAVHRENQGAFYARFHGIHIARGDVLLFLDSDDTFRQDALEKLAKAFENHQPDMVLFEAEACSDFLTSPVSLSLGDGVIYSGESKTAVYRKLIETRELNSVCLKAIRRECVSVPDRFANLGKIHHGEDLLFSTHLIAAAESILFLKEGLYHYRVRQGSVTRSFSAQRFDSIKTVHNEINRYIDLWNPPELKAVHNSRKVDGCVVALRSVLAHRHEITKKELQNKLQILSQDTYFVEAYQNMDSSKLSRAHRILAFCLYHRRFGALVVLETVRKLLSNLKHHFIR